ncbi:MAG: Wzz/FepE/Etk N-terminal domain-containing protein [candidate division Zixibacteria bacterium]|nr:Wzz/FepE/Etk N-terminal domain-containing protein [candidate division Zixibacteria bacterium]
MGAATEKSINIRDIISIVIKRKWLIIIPLLIVTGLAYGVTYFLEPEYESSTIIWIDKPSSVSRELVNILGRERNYRESGDDRRNRLQALQNEITSRVYLHQLIRELNLDENPEITRKAAKMRERNSSFSLEQLKLNLLDNQLRKQISVSFAGADQIKLTVKSNDAVLARDMVTALTKILEQEKNRYELENILNNQTFADMQLQKTEYHYQQVIDSLTEAQKLLAQLQLPESISSESNLHDISSDIERSQLEIDDYKSNKQRLKKNLSALELEWARIEYTDSIVELRAEIDAQITQYANLMGKYEWNTYNVINENIRLNDKLKILESVINEAVDEQFASYPENHRDLLKKYFVLEERLDILQSRKHKMQQSLVDINERVDKLPQIQTEISELERHVDDARKYRDAFKSEEVTVSILSERIKDRTKYKIIEPAKIPFNPVWPDVQKILLMGVMLGLILGVAAVFLAEIFDNSFKKVEDVENSLKLSVLATIPKIEKLKSIR